MKIWRTRSVHYIYIYIYIQYILNVYVYKVENKLFVYQSLTIRSSVPPSSHDGVCAPPSLPPLILSTYFRPNRRSKTILGCPGRRRNNCSLSRCYPAIARPLLAPCCHYIVSRSGSPRPKLALSSAVALLVYLFWLICFISISLYGLYRNPNFNP